MTKFILRFKLFGAAHAVEITPSTFNLDNALKVVRMEGQGHSHDLLVVRGDTTLLTVTKANIFDNLQPRLEPTPLATNGHQFQSVPGLSPTRDLANWLLSKEVTG